MSNAINVLADVNFWLDAVRHRDTLAAAVENRQPRMVSLTVAWGIGDKCGIRFHTGDHVIHNVRRALSRQELSRSGVAREAWSRDDIDRFVILIHKVVEATGGRSDVETVSHHSAIGQARFSGAPDGEDHQVLIMAARSEATVLATNDKELLEIDTFSGVEIWSSDEIDGEIHANVRRLDREAAAAAAEASI